MSKAKPLTHDDIRAIMREELEKLLVAPHEPRTILGRESETKRLSRVFSKLLGLLEVQLKRLDIVVLERDRDRRMNPDESPRRRPSLLVRNSNTEPSPVLSETQLHRCLDVEERLVVHDKGLSAVSDPVNELSHETSPSADGVGAHSVGDRQVAEVAQAASATSADNPLDRDRG